MGRLSVVVPEPTEFVSNLFAKTPVLSFSWPLSIGRDQYIMPSEPQSASPTAIAMAATRTVATAHVKSPS